MPALGKVTSVWQTGQMRVSEALGVSLSHLDCLNTQRAVVHGCVPGEMHGDTFRGRSGTLREREDMRYLSSNYLRKK